jgi:hypothetical protein
MLFQNTCTHALAYSADLLPIEHLCNKLDMRFRVLQLTKVQGPSADEGPKDWNHIPVPQTTVRRVRADVLLIFIIKYRMVPMFQHCLCKCGLLQDNTTL